MRTSAIAVGGAFGTGLRIAALSIAPNAAMLFAINLLGALLLGLWWGHVEARRAPHALTPLIATGALGSFTTFSALTDAIATLSATAPWSAAGYGAASVLGGLLAAGAGYAWGRGR